MDASVRVDTKELVGRLKGFFSKCWQRFGQLLKYGFWGILVTLFNLLLLYLFVEGRMHYLVANVLSYSIAVVVSYFTNSYFVFTSSEKKSFVHFVKFLIVRIISIACDSSLLYITVSIFALPLMPAKVAISFLIILLTYLANKLYVFGKKRTNEE